MVSKKNTKHRITISLDAAIFAEISRIADENNVSRAWVIRYAVEALRKNGEGQQKQLLLPLDRKKGHQE